MRIAPGGSQNLTAQRHGVGNIEVAEVEVVLCEADAIAPRRAQRPAFAQGLAQIVKIERFFGIHCRYSLEFGPAAPASKGSIGATMADR